MVLIALMLVPPARHSDWTLYYARFVLLTAIISFCWMCLVILFDRVVLIGYFVFVVGIIGLIIGSFVFKHTVERRVIDATLPNRRFQITIKNIFFWMIAVAFLFGYYSWHRAFFAN